VVTVGGAALRVDEYLVVGGCRLPLDLTISTVVLRIIVKPALLSRVDSNRDKTILRGRLVTVL
jgi:hypothetical protein